MARISSPKKIQPDPRFLSVTFRIFRIICFLFEAFKNEKFERKLIFMKIVDLWRQVLLGIITHFIVEYYQNKIWTLRSCKILQIQWRNLNLNQLEETKQKLLSYNLYGTSVAHDSDSVHVQ